MRGLKNDDFGILKRSLRVAWIKRITQSRNASWKIIPNRALSQHGGLEFLIENDYDPTYSTKRTSWNLPCQFESLA